MTSWYISTIFPSQLIIRHPLAVGVQWSVDAKPVDRRTKQWRLLSDVALIWQARM